MPYCTVDYLVLTINWQVIQTKWGLGKWNWKWISGPLVLAASLCIWYFTKFLPNFLFFLPLLVTVNNIAMFGNIYSSLAYNFMFHNTFTNLCNFSVFTKNPVWRMEIIEDVTNSLPFIYIYLKLCFSARNSGGIGTAGIAGIVVVGLLCIAATTIGLCIHKRKKGKKNGLVFLFCYYLGTKMCVI